MTQRYVVPNIYQDISDQSQGYFAFRFSCQECYWSVDTRPIRSTVSTISNVMDIGVGLLGGFWGRAAQAGEQMYGSKWHTEQADALQKAWGEIQHEFHLCPKCHRTVCMRCFNVKLNLCTACAPDIKADGAQFQHEMNIEAQRKQIEQNYRAPQFNINNIPSAVSPDMINPPAQSYQQQRLPQPPQAQQVPTPASIAGFSTPGYPQASCVLLAAVWDLPENSARTVAPNCPSPTSSVPTAPPPSTQAHASAPNAAPNSKAQHN